ncbi:TetR family transcriptional regulator [Pseudonocardia sp. CNS-004]|nr:TetR family transcriptional regulator [Pseudonocardia sp. CNS-004]
MGAQRDVRRREICDAVLAVVDDAGIAAVSLTTVAAQAGVSAGRVQHYFPSRAQLLEAAFDRSNERAVDRITALTAQDPSPRAALTAVLTDLVPHDDATRTHMRVRQSFTAQALADERVAARLRDTYGELARRLGEIIAGEVRTGAVATEEQPEHIAVRLVALAEGLAYHVLIGAHPADAARRQVLDAVAALYP